jgi:hypothetical protein
LRGVRNRDYSTALAKPLSWDTIEFAGGWTILIVFGAFLLFALLFLI